MGGALAGELVAEVKALAVRLARRLLPALPGGSRAAGSDAPRDEAEEAAPGSDEEVPGDPVELPIDGTLDLHPFRPRDLRTLVPDYLEACRARGIRHVRVVHGKGTGRLRESVHAILRRTPGVRSFRLAAGDGGSWGATLVDLDP